MSLKQLVTQQEIEASINVTKHWDANEPDDEYDAFVDCRRAAKTFMAGYLQLLRQLNLSEGVIEELQGSNVHLAEGLANLAALVVQQKQLPGDVAAALAHRACCGVEHDTANGKLHGHCVVCGVPWPCETAASFLRPNPLERQLQDRIAMLGFVQNQLTERNRENVRLRALLVEILQKDDAAIAELRQLGLETEAVTLQLTELIRQTLAGVPTP